MSATTLTVVGDSFVEGRGDPVEGGGYRGWVPRFAGQIGLRSNKVRNFGTHGATTTNVLDLQLPGALSTRSSLYGVVVGVNDLVSDYERARFEDNLHSIFDKLRTGGATVFTASYPDIPGRLPVPVQFRELLRERFTEANAALTEVARATGTLLLDIASSPQWSEGEMWTLDGLHPSSIGHRQFAASAVELVYQTTATTLAA
ncbi:SGNH/GDSL hydrolase family protein [Rhodococcus sp. H29-C3]|uniref:SGNH/GDSL hydrolase family protein n=1 Tax=Rhodococcus sp. H29-C3 TaxID=3046307 RepID=UPI0024B99CE7|nr:SGNH/GDSL hydrolase family protein [Rhodococcus sp. H29-C3]MDJ0362803.1 SGNH/GDSL hydrolase family protein [Rhodococcus sp. H29-C3]